MKNLSSLKIRLLTLLVFLFSFSISESISQDKSGVSPQALSLPSGPGSIDGLGESFDPLLSSGASSLSFDLSLPPGIAGLLPKLNLSYHSGFGNGCFGLGWKLDEIIIQRQTDKGLPLYVDSDTYIYSNGDELIPITSDIYRLKNEELFSKFERKGNSWIIHSQNGNKIYLGQSANQRIVNSLGIFKWKISRIVDINGNEVRYTYLKDQGQSYCSKIEYNNFGRDNSVEILFEYEIRSDQFSDYRSREGIITALRCKSISMFCQGVKVHSYLFEYKGEEDFSLLSSVTKYGGEQLSFIPPLAFDYTEFTPGNLGYEEMQNTASSLSDPNTELIDMNGDGLPELLSANANNHTFIRNLGRGRWQGFVSKMVNPNTGEPSSPDINLSSPQVRFADCNSDGYADMMKQGLESSQTNFSFYAQKGEEYWEDAKEFNNRPDFSLTDPNVITIDLNNDRSIDVLKSDSRSNFRFWLNLNEETWSDPVDVAGIDPSNDIRFSNPKVKVADMNGDRMLDIVLIDDFFIQYYPNKGFGNFGAPISMGNHPNLSISGNLVEIIDINRDGIADLTLIESSQVKFWLNLGNNNWSRERLIPNTPLHTSSTTIRCADMNGNGSIDILWNESISGKFFYLDMAGESDKSYLLSSVDNGMGKLMKLEYTPSTEYYLDALEAGNPWTRKLPFPVLVVSKSTIIDKLSRQEYVTKYSYRNGYYDGIEKEFRGFEVVRKIEIGDISAPTKITEYEFHLGEAAESLKGKTKRTTEMDENNNIFSSKENNYEVKELFTGLNGKKVSFPFIKSDSTHIYEKKTSPKVLHDSYEFDRFGNLIQHNSYGVIEGKNYMANDDELFRSQEFIIDTSKWILDRLKRIYHTDENGELVKEEKYYYDGQEFEGLPYGQIGKGNINRIEINLGPLLNNRWIQKVRYGRDQYGNIVKTKDANGSVNEVDFGTNYPVLPIKEIINTNTPAYPEVKGTMLITQAEYDYGHGVIKRFIDFNSDTSFFEYDDLGRVIKVIKPGDTYSLPTSQFEYHLSEPYSFIRTEEREDFGKENTITSIQYYDGLGRLVESKQEAENGKFILSNATIFNKRQGKSKVLNPFYSDKLTYESFNPQQIGIEYKYDELGRVTKTVLQDSSYTQIKYFPLGKEIYDAEDTDSLSSHYLTPQKLRFDGRNRLIQLEESNKVSGNIETYTTRYQYNLLDSLVKVIDDAGNEIETIFDTYGRRIQLIDPDRGNIFYVYDDQNNLKWTEDNKGQVWVRRYDGANRVKSEGESTRARIESNEMDYDLEITYYHDGELIYPYHNPNDNTKGKLLGVRDRAGLQVFKYDDRGNETFFMRKFSSPLNLGGIIQPGLELSMWKKYDAKDRLANITYPDGLSLSYKYNPRSLLSRIPHFVKYVSYNSKNQVTKVEYNNGVSEELSYDDRFRLIQEKVQSDDVLYQHLTYLYDNNSNPIQIKDLEPNIIKSFSRMQDLLYDDLYRINSSKRNIGKVIFQYSSIGNLVSKTSNIPYSGLNLGTISYGENAGPHAATSIAGNPRFYDENGNQISYSNRSYSFDYKNRLERVNLENGEEVSFVYGAGIEKIQKNKTTSLGLIQNEVYPSGYYEIRRDKAYRYIQSNQRIASLPTNFELGSILPWDFMPDYSQPIIDSDANGEIALDEIRLLGYDTTIVESEDFFKAFSVFMEENSTTGFISLAVIYEAYEETQFKSKISIPIHILHHDNLRNINLITDSIGTQLSQIEYFPYGKFLPHGNSDNSFYFFDGFEYDKDLGLYNLSSRYYDPSIGRFINPDLKVNSFDRYAPQSFNPYSFGLNNPLMYTDFYGFANAKEHITASSNSSSSTSDHDYLPDHSRVIGKINSFITHNREALKDSKDKLNNARNLSRKRITQLKGRIYRIESLLDKANAGLKLVEKVYSHRKEVVNSSHYSERVTSYFHANNGNYPSPNSEGDKLDFFFRYYLESDNKMGLYDLTRESELIRKNVSASGTSKGAEHEIRTYLQKYGLHWYAKTMGL